MSESQVFQLERFYIGTLVDNQQRTSTAPGVIARTPNITSAQAAACVRLAPLIPPPPHEITGTMPGALGLFRGESTNFILVKAQLNDAGYPQLLYILLPVTPLRWLGGNVLAFRPLAMMDMPSFALTKPNLLPFELRNPTPANAEEQTEYLLDLLMYCHDSVKTVGGILAALIQGWPIAIVNSPPDIDLRLRFVQGLLTLLPPPARIGITFATYVQDPLSAPVQIKFLNQPAVPLQHLVYDWQTGKILSAIPEDTYSRYIIAQFRLDPAAVVEQTAHLARTAVWRAAHKENLGRALAWVARRAALDQTVREGQPADRETVMAILSEDPTLPDDLRLIYARHLLAFTLALEETESADIIPTIAVTNPALAEAVAVQLRAAIDNQQARVVYSLLERWLLRVPETASLSWYPVIQQAAIAHLSNLIVQQRIHETVEFIACLQQAHPALHLSEVISEMVAAIQPAARSYPEVAQALFLLAVEMLAENELHRLLSDTLFTRQLPRPTQVALAYLEPEPRQPAPPQLLELGARPYGDGYHMLVLARLTEWAMYLQRPELIDTAALQALLVMAQSSRAKQFDSLIQRVVEDFSQFPFIQVLEPAGKRVLVQLLLQMHDFDRAVGLLEFYQHNVFRPELLGDFARLAGDVFYMSPLPNEQLAEALSHLEGSQIRPEPRAMIFCGALLNRQWADNQEYAARRLTTMIFNDNSLIKVIGYDNALRLLEFHARQRNALDTLRVAAALVDNSLDLGEKGAVYLTQMWPSITWDAEVADAALELLRRYLRGIPLEQIPKLLAYFEEELGAHIADALRATYLIRLAMGGRASLTRFVDDVHTAAQLFVDLATTYHTNKEPPPNHRLRRELDTMTGGLSEGERRQVAHNTYYITRQVIELGRDRTQKQGRQPVEELLIQGKITPKSGVDLLRFTGGHFAQQAIVPLDLDQEAMAHLFGSRSAAMFLRETEAITNLLDGLQIAFQMANDIPVTPRALAKELDSLWQTLSLYNQRKIQDQFAQDCQYLAEVISIMADRAKTRILSDSGPGRDLETGQRQPRSALEALRWINGYFARKHIRTRT